MFYPFILMDIQAGNGLSDPWSGEAHQPAAPWRGRITLAERAGPAGSTDKTAGGGDEVAAFFGEAAVRGFRGAGEHGRLRRAGGMVVPALHSALCASLRAAGGVDAFCIGSEMRGLTQIRDRRRAIRRCGRSATWRRRCGRSWPGAKIGYAADWSEYFGHQPPDGSGDVFFHLDPLWAQPTIDFVGIDNYMPLSDWRDGRSMPTRRPGRSTISTI